MELGILPLFVEGSWFLGVFDPIPETSASTEEAEVVAHDGSVATTAQTLGKGRPGVRVRVPDTGAPNVEAVVGLDEEEDRTEDALETGGVWSEEEGREEREEVEEEPGVSKGRVEGTRRAGPWCPVDEEEVVEEVVEEDEEDEVEEGAEVPVPVEGVDGVTEGSRDPDPGVSWEYMAVCVAMSEDCDVWWA